MEWLKSEKLNIFSLTKAVIRMSPIYFVFRVVQSAINSVFPVIIILFSGRFIDQSLQLYNNKIERQEVYLTLMFLILLIGAKLVVDTVVGFVLSKQIIKINQEMTLNCVKYRAMIDYSYVDNGETYMKLQRVLDDLPSKMFLSTNIFFALLSNLMQIGNFVLVFAFTGMWWIGAALLCFIVPNLFLVYRNGVRTYNLYKTNFPEELSMHHSTYIMKERELSSERALFEFTKGINNKWKKKKLNLFGKKLSLNNKIIRLRYTSKLINIGIVFLAIIFMTQSFLRDYISVGIYMALISNTMLFTQGIVESLSALINDIALTKEYLLDLKEISKFSTNEEYLAKPAPSIDFFDSIEFKNVSFQYPGTTRTVLKNVSFTIRKDIRYAFVGKNGAGKSTIIKLMTGLYNDYSGQILINGNDIRNYSVAELKQIFGIVYQDFAKYQLSMQDNIEIGTISSLKGESEERQTIENTLHTVGLSEVVSKLDNGLATHLGRLEDNGVDLSGGEWQRVALARLLLRDSWVYILDEPTASLDPRAENEIYKMFEYALKNKTGVLITHRLGAIKIVDYIYVINDGEIHEEGTHNNLINNNSLYAKMYNEQKGWYS